MIKIIKEVLNKYINNLIVESLTPIVYHFCDLSAFIGIASYNKFILTSSNTNQSDKRMAANGEYVYPYYMCFSRTKSPDVGYAYQRLLLTKYWQSCLVRLEIDGNKLNNLYKAHPVNYFINDNDDKIKKYDKGLNPNVDYKQIARQQMYEYEDRLLSTKPFINNVNKYIKRVDILVKPRIFTDGRCAGLKSNIEYIINGNTSIETGKIYVYTDKIAFNHGDITKALPKEKFINPNGNQTSISLQLSESALKPIASIINILCFSETQKPKKYLIQKYGFSDYTEKLLELCDSQNSVIHVDNLSTQM